MNRKKFLRNLGTGVIAAPVIPTILTSCNKDDDSNAMPNPNACAPSPTEVAGPFPIKTPSDWIRTNIVGNRSGVALMINITVQNTNANCAALEGVFVDVWMCDAKGNYSEYNEQLDGDFTAQHFLRGRQTSNAEGKVSFVSIYPGWYPGRAPHIHLEVKRGNSSLLVTQIAFPENISKTVYATNGYKGNFDTTNASDGEFSNSLNNNMADSVTGNTTDGYTLTKIIKVKG
ncbi:intradiol ring-cleavage dioxygenase [Flagellimonas sp.]|uniref:dioxygenase family protein n=1 Tax=Flagellimonas sp. TaxID=2058762 RepID=UPI003B5042FA